MTSIERTLEWQADHADMNGAPSTGRLIRGFVPLLDTDLATGRRMRDWPGLSLEDAMPLRLAGGFHSLFLTGQDERLGSIYKGEVVDQSDVDQIVLSVARDHDTRLLGWFDGPPQTNEAGRSAGIMAQLLWLSERVGTRFELYELGASAGINTMMDRFAFDLGGVKVGPADSPILIQPEWRGPPPPPVSMEIVAIEGCDVAPIDLTDPEQALRLKSYVWPEVTARLARVDAAIAMASRHPPALEKADARDFVERVLARAQESGVTRVLFHTVVWQYFPPDTRASIEAAMRRAGAEASSERPLAWVTVETNRQTFRHELRCRFWPGGEHEILLGEAHAHGAWIEWLGMKTPA
ncbi:MAG TPA: DUF2332 domain-containing protein [Novosphingobium sp.]|nr:DUF2332 domain-containing protein [Novosphingobium sp.]